MAGSSAPGEATPRPVDEVGKAQGRAGGGFRRALGPRWRQPRWLYVGEIVLLIAVVRKRPVSTTLTG